jgi:hypothetical protein
VTDEGIEGAVEALRAITDPVERALAAHRLQGRISTARRDVSVIRTETVRELRTRGWSHQQVADLLGISRGNAQGIAEGRGLNADARDAGQPED